MVVDIVKIALHDERPIISRIDAYWGRVMVTSKKQGGGEDWSFHRKNFPIQRKVRVGGGLRVVTHYESIENVF